MTIVLGAAATMPQWMGRLLNVSEPWQAWWLLVGLAAQTIFLARWVFQWVASERRRESVMPTVFWWLSLAGATMLLVYYVGRREPIGVLSQLIGWTVYMRNLHLIRARRSR